jgi:hypothetical protein
MSNSLRGRLRAQLISCESCYAKYRRLKYTVARVRVLTYYLYDVIHTAKYMFWGRDESLPRAQLQAKILFFYHKIEKGMSLPGKKRMFGVEVIPQVTSMLEIFEQNFADIDDPIYKGAVSSLHAYADLIQLHQLDKNNIVLPALLEFLSRRNEGGCKADTPMYPVKVLANHPILFDEFKELMTQRRSYRDFSNKKIHANTIIVELQIKRKILAGHLR